jgi:hypothetical protein
MGGGKQRICGGSWRAWHFTLSNIALLVRQSLLYIPLISFAI